MNNQDNNTSNQTQSESSENTQENNISNQTQSEESENTQENKESFQNQSEESNRNQITRDELSDTVVDELERGDENQKGEFDIAQRIDSAIKEKLDIASELLESHVLLSKQRTIILFLSAVVVLLVAVLFVDTQTGDVILPAFKERVLLPGLNLTESIIKEYFEDYFPGVEYMERGIVEKHPVVVIPGFVTTGLELWQGDPCAMKYFRQRMWGTLTMMESMLRSPECWMKHMSLDPNTGLDPEGVKIRPAVGLEAADYLFPGYWVWGKLIQNLGYLGYDTNDIYMASYDWRLALELNNERDHYFDKLKMNIELLRKSSGEKVTIISHSMGSIMALQFMKYSDESTELKNWVDENIDSWINIGGPLLGVMKSVSSYISGEMKDTTQFEVLQNYLLDPIVSKESRRNVMRSWGSIASMMPKGGNKIWGHHNTPAPDDSENQGLEYLLKIKTTEGDWKNLTAEEAMDFVFETLRSSNNTEDHNIANNLNKWYSFGAATDKLPGTEETINGRTHIKQEMKYWTNPLETQLPYAPNMKIYCLYGVGKQTERGFISTMYLFTVTITLQISLMIPSPTKSIHIITIQKRTCHQESYSEKETVLFH
eukprot:TRINITY_DN4711_c0_g1_i2.p1 TRINITY_DN4711_c0_g1~~TRINITY_DN4711_c0_g1_i2.p1  ORF type:complete len:598 (-),score=128.54 TRINITY_DN4711_c0_g1_i2:237-2030(-)